MGGQTFMTVTRLEGGGRDGSRRADGKIHKTGGLDVIVQDEVPVPTPKDDEVLVKVQWT
jgi:hypothetical protein